MPQLGKMIVLLGAVLVVLGAGIWALGKAGFRGMPGDIRYESDHVQFYFPVTTCIVMSIALTLVAWLWRWLSRP